MKNLIIGTAGHIDHGKSALVKALTGIETDRLEEEKQRGITIDIGFAHLDLADHRIGFIDVPGHEKFVKNMLAGIGGVDLLLLVIAADESIMPQTVEHFQICTLLGISSGVVVITKKSLVDEELLLLVKEEAADLVRGSFLEHASVVAVDSLTGEGIEELKKALETEIRKLDRTRLTVQRDQRIFRLPIDRVFTIKGFGTVVTGTTFSGKVERDGTIAVYPSGKNAKVRGIEIFNLSSDQAEAGQRTALNLTGVQKDDLQRGMELSISDGPRPTQILDVELHLLESAPGILKHRAPIRFHHGSAELIGRIHLLGEKELSPGSQCYAQIRLESPTVVFPGDRFVLRRYSPLSTIGGGSVLDNEPRKFRTRHLKERLPQLKRLASAISKPGSEEIGEQVRVIVESSGTRGADLKALVARTGYTSQRLQEALEALEGIRLIPQEPPLAVDLRAFEEAAVKIVQFTREFQKQKPLAAGVPKEELKKRFLPDGSTSYFQAVLSQLEADGQLDISGGSVRLQGSESQLTEEQEDIREELLKLLRLHPFQSPGIEALIQKVAGSAKAVREVFFFLLNTGEIIRVSEDFLILPDQLTQLREKLLDRFPSGTAFTVPEFKDLLGISRKYAIPLLEYLDRSRITRRVGDKRTLTEKETNNQ